MSTDFGALLNLQAWLSPAFPVGGFAYSHGLEWAVEAGDVRDGETLRAWVADVLVHGSARSDVILLRAAHARCGDLVALRDVAEVGLAVAPARERREEALNQGRAFLLAVGAWGVGGHADGAWVAGTSPAMTGEGATGEGAWVAGAGPAMTEFGDLDLPYSVAVGWACGRRGVEVDASAAAYLQAFAANLISAAVRLVPLGQTVGLRVLAALETVILAVADETRAAGLDDLGGCAFRSDLAAMRHETQYTRLFRS